MQDNSQQVIFTQGAKEIGGGKIPFSPQAKGMRIAKTGRFSKQIGSTVYEVNTYFNKDAKECIEDKIIRLIRNEIRINELNYLKGYGIMAMSQMNRLPERSSL